MRASALAAAALALAVSLAAEAAPRAITVPGSFLVSTKLADNGHPFQCTAGFVVHDGRGPAVLTAGHCRRDPNNPAVLQRTPARDLIIGYHERGEVWPGVGFDKGRDVSLVRLNSSSIPVPLVSGMTVTRVAGVGELSADPPPIVCKEGSRTGNSCGHVTRVSATTVSFRAWDDLGDSGSPVYMPLPDGGAAAVGILFGHDDDPQGRVVNASLLGPILQEWGLNLG